MTTAPLKILLNGEEFILPAPSAKRRKLIFDEESFPVHVTQEENSSELKNRTRKRAREVFSEQVIQNTEAPNPHFLDVPPPCARFRVHSAPKVQAAVAPMFNFSRVKANFDALAFFERAPDEDPGQVERKRAVLELIPILENRPKLSRPQVNALLTLLPRQLPLFEGDQKTQGYIHLIVGNYYNFIGNGNLSIANYLEGLKLPKIDGPFGGLIYNGAYALLKRGSPEDLDQLIEMLRTHYRSLTRVAQVEVLGILAYTLYGRNHTNDRVEAINYSQKALEIIKSLPACLQSTDVKMKIIDNHACFLFGRSNPGDILAACKLISNGLQFDEMKDVYRELLLNRFCQILLMPLDPEALNLLIQDLQASLPRLKNPIAKTKYLCDWGRGLLWRNESGDKKRILSRFKETHIPFLPYQYSNQYEEILRLAREPEPEKKEKDKKISKN